MAALAANRTITVKGLGAAVVLSLAAAVDIFYSGALIVVDQDTGYAEPATDAATKKFVGLCTQKVDNSSGSAGDVKVPVAVGVEVNCVAASATQAWVGNKVYAVDDQTVALAATTSTDVEVGICTEFVSATEVRVLLNPHGAVGA